MDAIVTFVVDARLRDPPVGAAAARLPRRPHLRNGRGRRYRARGQDAGRRLRRGGGCVGLAFGPSSASAWPSWSRSPFALIHGFASITHRGNQIVSGVAINFIAAGSTVMLGQAWFSQGGRTPALQPGERFEAIDSARRRCDAGTCRSSGPIYAELISGHSILVYIAFLMVPLTWWVLFRTRFGLRLRAVGENPAAVDTAGISVAWLRYRALICTGILTGIAGAYLSMVPECAGFVKDMTAGKGYHSAGRTDLRQMETGQRHVRLPAVRLPRCGGNPPAGRHRCRSSARCRCSSCRPCPISSPSSCLPASSARQSRRAPAACPTSRNAKDDGSARAKRRVLDTIIGENN